MYPSLGNNGFNPPRTTFSGTCYNESNHSNDPQDHYHTPSSCSSYLLPSPIYIPLPYEDVPLVDEAVFEDFFRQQQFFSNGHNYENVILPQEMTANGDQSPMGECSYNNGQVVMNDGDDDHCDFNTRVEHQSSSPGKRASKRDRHSKINTARGPRDRRMRLSLDVARKLFGLQDLLGLDKASKTVDWLLTQSKAAIQELFADQRCSFMDVSNSSSSTSECEVLSGTGDQSVVKAGDDQETTKNKAKCSSGSIKKQKERITRVVRRCADFHHPDAKASRERARKRARERTLLKKNNKQSGGQDPKVWPFSLHQPMDQDIYKFEYSISVDESQRQSVGQFDQISSNFQFKQGFVGDNSSLLMTGNWSPSYLFNMQQSSGRTHEMIKAWEGNNN